MVIGLLVPLAAPAASDAALFRGKTSQRLAAGLRTAQGETVKALRIAWRAPCRKPGIRYLGTTTFATPLDRSEPGSAQDGGRYRERTGGEVGIISVGMQARRVTPHRWSGTFSSSVVVRRRGRVIDRCRTKRVRWTAKIPRAQLDIAGEGHSVVQGNYSFATPADAVKVGGSRRSLGISAGGFSFLFSPPRGRTLRPGRFTNVKRFGGKNPVLDITGRGRGCNDVSGEFTVHSARFDRRGRLRAIDLSLVHYCEGSGPPLNARLRFSRA